MQVKAITCPQCAASLPVNEGDTFAVCPHCGSRCVIEYERGEQAALMPARFVDPATGCTAFTARVPAGWAVQGAIQPNNVMDNWITVTGAATAGNGYEKLLFETMSTYRMVKDDPQRRGFDEPMYSAQDMRLFWRYHRADEYADEIAAQIAGGTAVLEKRMALPGKKGAEWTSQEVYQRVWQMEQQAAAQFNQAAGGGMVYELRNMELTSALSLYRVPSQAGERAIILATMCKAIDATMTQTWGTALLGGGLGGGLLGGLLGAAQPGLGMGTENYIEWKPSYSAMLTEWPVAPASLEKFSAFVDSTELDPSVQQIFKQYSDRYDAQLASLVRQNNERWDRVSQFARQQSAELDQWRSDNWSRMREHDRQMAQIRDFSSTPSSFGGGETVDERVQRLRHEATYGVNTYERDDGTTYEHSTAADRVFENDLDSNLHVGTEGYYDDYVPDGWTELNRKP